MQTIKAADLERFLKDTVTLGLASQHPRVWNRFYRFIVLAHRYRKGWDAHYIEKRLKEYGIPNDKARMFAEAYWHGRCALRVRSRFSDSLAIYASWTDKGSSQLT